MKCQIMDYCKKGLGYNAVSPPDTGLFPPSKLDLSSTWKDSDAPIIEDWVSNDAEETVEKQEVKPSINRINFVKATTDNNPRETVQNGEQPKQNTYRNKGNQRNWNGMMFNKLVWNNRQRMNHKNHSNANRNHVPQAALIVSIARPLNAVHPKRTMNDVKKVNTVKPIATVNAAKAKAKHKAVKGKRGNDVKASACWVWKPKQKVLDHVYRHSSASITLTKFDYVDAQDYEEINGGYVAFGGNPKGEKITGKGTKDETSRTLKSFTTRVENLMNLKVKVIKCDIGTEFKNRETNQLCKVKGIMRKYSVAKTHQQNRVTKRRNKTLIEAARTMLADSKLPTTFWAKVVNTGSGPNWLFDIDALTKTMNYQPVVAQSNDFSCTTASNDLSKENECNDQWEEDSTNSTNRVNTVSLNINATSSSGFNVVGTNISIDLPPELNMPLLEDIGIFEDSHDDEDVFGAEADFHNLDFTFQVSPIPTTRIHRDHPLKQVIGDFHSAPQIRRMTKNLEEHSLVGTVIPRTDNEDLQNYLFACFLSQMEPKNMARLVAQGHTQEDGIDYDEVFAPFARIKAIRLFLAYASFKDSIVYQMDVKSAFLYGKIEEEVYPCQPPGFEDHDFSDKVYKVKMALYSLHQALTAWYKTLSRYLLDNGFKRGHIDKTLFIKRNKGDILLVQVYVDDIIFGSTKKEMCDAFEILMHEKFQMSSMGELTFLLGLQVKQKKESIFICQDKYVAEILKKFGFLDVKKANTHMETSKPLLKDNDGEEVDVHMYRSMIGSLMYLTLSRPDIMFTCKKQTAVANSINKAEYVAALSCCGQTNVNIKTVNDDVRLQALIDGKKVVINEAFIRHDLKLNDVEGTSCLSNVIIFEELARIGAKTTSWNEFSSTMVSTIICLANNLKLNFSKYILDNLKKNFEAGVPFYMFPRFIQIFVNHQLGDMSHHKGIFVNPSLSKTVFASMKRVGTGFSGAVTPLFGTMMVQALEEVLDLENKVIEMKSSYKAKITDLESRVEKLKEENMSLTKELKSFNTKVESLAIKETIMDKVESSKQGRKIADIDADVEVNLENVYNLDMALEETVLSMHDVDVQSERNDADVKEVAKEIVEVMEISKIIVDEVSTAGGKLNAANEEPVSTAPTNITTAQRSEATKIIVDITTAPKAKGIVFHDKEKSTTRTASSKSQAKDKGKAKLVEEPEILKSRKAQIAIDEEVTRRIKAE
nr:putative ribonuclease H-like domain-containing protein [Tanacetum cinerariifolium]